MELIYHTEICTKAIGPHFSKRAFEVIIAANHRIDGIFTGLLGHPEYHFDDNKFEESWAYIENQHQLISKILSENDNVEKAWKAFGRLLHVVQDFYSHSNYVELWLEMHSQNSISLVEKINGLDENIINSKDLYTAKVYFPLEALTYFPILRPLLRPMLPKDSHANMHLDSPDRGAKFPYAMEAALQRTVYEYDKVIKRLSTNHTNKFQGK